LNVNVTATCTPEHPLAWYGGGGIGASVTLRVGRCGLIAVPLGMTDTMTAAEGPCIAAAPTVTSSGDDRFAQCGDGVIVDVLLTIADVAAVVTPTVAVSLGVAATWVSERDSVGCAAPLRGERVDVSEPFVLPVGEARGGDEAEPNETVGDENVADAKVDMAPNA
jgi:hypothetical protein